MGRSGREMWIFKAPRSQPPPVSIKDNIVVESLSMYLNCTDCMLALTDLINRCSSIIIVVG
jgi:hypothetical protein